MSFDLAASIRKLNLTTTAQHATQQQSSFSEEDEVDVQNTFPINGAARKPNHTVEYRYPDLSLLPGHRKLHLPSPVSASYRQRPGAADLGVDLSNTAFYTISPLNTGTPPPRPSSDFNAAFKLSLEDRMAYGLISDMERLLYAPGRTILSLVTFLHKREPRFRVKRVTIFADGSKEDCLYQYTQEGWNLLGQPLGYDGEDRAWLRMLDNLYLRATDLAYFHVGKQLVSQGHAKYAEEEADGIRWCRVKSTWDTIDFVLHRMTYKGQDVDGVAQHMRLSRSRLMTLPEGAVVELPCEDFQMVSPRQIGNINPETDATIAITCATCGCSILTERDAVNMEVIGDGRARKVREKEVDWQKLDGPITQEYTKILLAESIVASLELARCSFTVPSSVIPMTLAPEICEETMMVSNALAEDLGTHLHMPASPVSLHKKLQSFAEGVLLSDAKAHGYIGDAAGLPTPPSWPTFAERWFRRTVNFVFCRQCDETPGGCRGTHWHGDETWYNPTFERPDAEEDEDSDDEAGRVELPDDDIFDAAGNRVLQDETDLEEDHWCA